MRRFASSWTTTLGRLGFRRRNVRGIRKHKTYRRGPAMEALEPRHMLTAHTVDTLIDVTASDGLTTLREAIASSVSGDTINFSSTLSGGTITLAQGGLYPTANISISGLGADKLTISGSNGSRAFSTGNSLTISDVTITGSGDMAAVVAFYGNVELNRVVITGNQTTGLYTEHGSVTINDSTIDSNAGGIYAWESTISIYGSTISNNSGDGINFIDNAFGSSLVVANSTISGNTDKGVLFSSFSYYSSNSNSSIKNTTITENAVGISVSSSENPAFFPNTLLVHNTIIAGNQSGAVANDVSGPLGSASSNNLIGVAGTSGLTNGVQGNIVGTSASPVDPKLGALAENDGLTKTHMLLPGSPAINAGSDSLAYGTTDQRGYNRFVHRNDYSTNISDIGAYELGFVVSTALDESDGNYSFGDLSLREAISLANANADLNQIEFAPELAGSKFLLLAANGQLSITNDVTIVGLGAENLTIDAQGNSRVFNITGSGTDVTLSGLTIAGGAVTGSGGGISHSGNSLKLKKITVKGSSASVNGAAVYVASGTLSVEESTIESNTGGGVYTAGTGVTIRDSSVNKNTGIGVRTTSGSLTVENSTIDGNSGSGLYVTAPSLMLLGSTISSNLSGGVFFSSINNATVTIANSTISGNVGEKGGGVQIWGYYITNNSIISSTIVNNKSTTTYDYYSAGLVVGGSSVKVQNTIIAGNRLPDGSHSDVALPYSSSLHAQSTHNFIGYDPYNFFSASNITGDTLAGPIDPKLSPLGSNGGKTKTHALLTGSQAINSGSNAHVLHVADQRGFARTVNGTVDIGAVESPQLIASTADFDGDGRNDTAMYDPTTGTLLVNLGSNAAEGSKVWGSLGVSSSASGFRVGDFNGDGRDDLMARNTQTNAWRIALSDSTLFNIFDLGITGSWTETYVGDFDGDGADELLGWATSPGEWNVVRYSEQLGATLFSGLTDWGTAVHAKAGSNTIYVGDINRDGFDDLVAKETSTNKWWVGLAQPASKTFTQHDWGNWFDAFATGAQLNNLDGPYQQLVDAFSSVYNNVALELYPGLMKGPTAAEETRSGNDWDQAALLVQKLPAAAQATIYSGLVSIPIDIPDVVGQAETFRDLKAWVGAESSSAVLSIIKAAFDADAVIDPLNSNNITFEHAVVQAIIPTAAGAETKLLDPSWKFKNYQDGVTALGTFDEFDFLTQATSYFRDYTGSLYFNPTAKADARELPLDYFEDAVMRDLIDNHTGSSLADVAYNGPIIQQSFRQMPFLAHAITSGQSEGTFSQIVAAGDTSLLTHRIKVSLKNDSTGADQWTPWIGIIPNISLDSLVIENRTTSGSQFESKLYRVAPDGTRTLVAAASNLSQSGTYNLDVQILAPDQTTYTNPPKTQIAKDETLAISLGVGQLSATRLSDKLKLAVDIGNAAAPTVADLGDFLAYAGAKYWYDVDTSSDAIAGLTHSSRIGGVSAALLRAGSDINGHLSATSEELKQTPFHIFPDKFSIDAFQIANNRDDRAELTGGFLSTTNGAVNSEAVQLFVYQYSALEHSIMEEMTGAEGVSAVKLLQMAFSRVNNAGSADGKNLINVLQYKVVNNKVELWFRDSHSTPEPSSLNGHIFNSSATGAKLWTSTTNWNSSWQPDITLDKPGLTAALKTFLDDGSYGYSTGDAQKLADHLVGQAGGVSNQTPSYILVPRGNVNVGASNTWVGTGYIVSHGGGAFKAAVFPDGGTFIDGGTIGGDPTDVNQPSGSFINQTSQNQVGTANGNVMRQDTDLVFPNMGQRMDFVRTYNSQFRVYTEKDSDSTDYRIKNLGFGPGWTHSFSDKLVYWGKADDSQSQPDLVWYASDGSMHFFAYEDGEYRTPPELFGKLKLVNESPGSGVHYVFLDRDGTEYHFNKVSYDGDGDNEGEIRAQLIKKVDITGHGYVITYDSASPRLITEVVDYYGKPQDAFSTTFSRADESTGQNGKLVFTYESKPNGVFLIDTITKHVWNGSSYQQVGVWSYDYEQKLTASGDLHDGEDGWRLTKAYSPTDSHISTAFQIQYDYYDNPDAPAASVPEPVRGLLKKVTEPNGEYRLYDYYDNGRAFRVKRSIALGTGGAPDTTATTLYSYNFVQNRTEVIDALDRTETYIFQDNGLQTKQIHADRSRIETIWGEQTPPVASNEDDVLHGVYKPTDHLLLKAIDEIGAQEDYEYFAATDGFKYRELKQTISKRFVDEEGDPLDPSHVLVTTYDYDTPQKYGGSTANTLIHKIKKITVQPGTRNLETEFTYDTWGRLTQTEDALGNKTSSEYVNDTTRNNGLLKYTVTPNGFDSAGDSIYYRSIGNVDISSGTLTVALPFSGTAAIPLDAVRLDRVGNVGGALSGATADILVIDDESSSGFATTGSGVTNVSLSDSGLVGKTAKKLTASGSQATWTFANLLPGRYRVSISIVAISGGASTATYKIYDGTTSGTLLSQPTVNLDTTTDSSNIFRDTRTEFAYDAAGNVISTTIDNLRAAASVFNPQGNVTQTTDRTGVSAVATFDVLGRKHTGGYADPDGAGALTSLLTTYNYNTGGRLSSKIDPLGRSSSLTYDLRGNVVTRTNPDGTTVKSTFDEVGHLTSQTDELGRTTRYVYDGRDRLVQTIHPDGTSELVQYDGVGHIKDRINANGYRTRTTYDAMGHVVSTIQANVTGSTNSTSTNTYDDLGRVTQTQDFNGNVTQYEYDILNRVIQTRVLNHTTGLPPVALTTEEYDNNGNVIRSTTYDAERITASTGNGGAGLTLPTTAASLIGWLDPSHANYAAVRPFVHSVKTNYDSSNRAVKTTDVDGHFDTSTSTYSDVSRQIVYDAAGRSRYATDELGRRTEIKYDAYGRLQQTLLPEPTTGAGQPTTTNIYDANGNITAVIDPNGHTSVNQYDVFDRLIASIDAEGNKSKTVFDIAGQVIASIDALGHAAYTLYDDRGRTKLSRVADPDGAGALSAPGTKYEYDSVGNVIAITGPNGYRTTYQYDARNRKVKEFTTDVQIYDEDAATVTAGTPTNVPNVEGSFGRDHKRIAGTTTVVPAAKWTFDNLVAGTYRVLMTWDGATWDGSQLLDTNATAQLQRFDSGNPNPQQTLSESANQSVDPNEFALDYQGQWRGWQDLGTLTVSPNGKIEVTLTGHTNKSIRADAVMLERVVEQSYAYDAAGNVTSQTDTLGRTHTNEYDELSRLIKTTSPDPDGAGDLQAPVTEMTYNGFGNVSKVIERRGSAADRTEVRTYDKRNRLVQSIANYQNGAYSSSATDEDIITQKQYDDAGNLTRVISVVNSSEQVGTDYEYDNLNRLKAENTQVGSIHHRTEYQYDAIGNKTRSESFVYDQSDSDVASTVTTYSYDDANRLIKQVDDVGTGGNFVNATTMFVYNAVGKVVRQTDPTNHVTTHEYDRLNRLVKTTQPNPGISGGGRPAPTMQFVYDVLGNTSRSTNGEGETNQSIYDTRGRQISKFDGLGNETRYVYDSQGNLSRITDANGNDTTYTYDALNRLLTVTNELTDERTKTYDDAGNVASVEDRNGRVRNFTYDGLDRLTKEEWLTNSTVVETLTWQYDAMGRVKLAKHVEGTSTILNVDTFDYDALGRLTERRNYDPNGDDTPGTPDAKLIYAYDQITIGSGLWHATAVTERVGSTDVATTTYSTDRLGRLAVISDNVLEEASSGKSVKTIAFSYDAAGRLTSIVRDSVSGAFDLDTFNSYDGTGRLSEIRHSLEVSNSRTAAFNYEYDAASRITAIDSEFQYSALNFTRAEDFTFDDAGRLTTSVGGYTNRNGTTLGFAIDNDFELDGTGNRTSTAVDGGSALSADIGPNNQLADDGAYSYTYDEEGNLTRRDSNSDNSYTTYAWDHRNRLVKVQHYNNSLAKIEQIDYRYNDGDLRVRRTVSSTFDGSGSPMDAVAEHFIYDGDQVAMLVEADGDVGRRYLYAGTDELLVDEVFNEAGTVGQAERGYWALTDHAGTVHELIESDADGTASSNHWLVQHLDYDSSGKIVRAITLGGVPVALDALFSEYAFAGREWDGDAGLYYNRARWYDGNSGRFISQDPIGFDGGDANLYRYGGGDPINNVDPSGHSWLSKAFRSIKKDIKGIVNGAKSFLHDPVEYVGNMASDPMFWVSMIVPAFGIRLPFAGFTFGPFSYGVGMQGGGAHLSMSWMTLGKEVVSGTGFGPAMATISTPVFSMAKPIFAQPVRYVQAGIDQPAESSSAMPGDRRENGSIILAAHEEENGNSQSPYVLPWKDWEDKGIDSSGGFRVYRDPKTGAIWGESVDSQGSPNLLINKYGYLDRLGNFVTHDAIDLPPEPTTLELGIQAALSFAIPVYIRPPRGPLTIPLPVDPIPDQAPITPRPVPRPVPSEAPSGGNVFYGEAPGGGQNVFYREIPPFNGQNVFYREVPMSPGRNVFFSELPPCFPPGTLVLMANGSTQKIEEIKVGDMVLALDPENGTKPVPHRVVDTCKNWTERLIHIGFKCDDDSSACEIVATGNHPMWTQTRGWQVAEEIVVGDRLQDEKGNSIVVSSVRDESITSDTHNLLVDEAHTYYVVIRGVPILVHNGTIHSPYEVGPALPVGTNVGRFFGPVINGETPVGGSPLMGRYWTPDSLNIQTRTTLGLNWSNTAEYYAEGVVIGNKGASTNMTRAWGEFPGGGVFEGWFPEPQSQIALRSITVGRYLPPC